MPSYQTIIDHLISASPDTSAHGIIAGAWRLMPQGENTSDSDSVNAAMQGMARAWATRLAFESLRGWRWPYWINLQTNPSSGQQLTAQHLPVMYNLAARDARPIVQQETGHFAGTMDARGMVTPREGNLSVEVWFRTGNRVVHLSNVFDPTAIHFDDVYGEAAFCLETSDYRLLLQATAKVLDDFEYIALNGTLERKTANSPAENAPVAPTEPSAETTVVYMAIRPYTIDGVTPIHDLVYNSKGFWMSDSKIVAVFPHRPDIAWCSNALHGDAGLFLLAPPERTAVRCPAGMASAVSAFHIAPDDAAPTTFECILPTIPAYPREVPFHHLMHPEPGSKRKSTITEKAPVSTTTITETTPLMAASLDQLIAATDVAAPVIQQMLIQRNQWIVVAVRALQMYDYSGFAARLLKYSTLNLGRNGYLPQSHGKWAFQGQFLTALADFYRDGNQTPDDGILRYTQIKSIARWIIRKRHELSHAPKKPAGLFPPGTTPNGIGREYQVADNIWGIEGLAAASWLARQYGEHTDADLFHAEATGFAGQLNAAIHRELEYGILQRAPGRLHRAFDPSSTAELLDLAIAHEAYAMLSPHESWVSQALTELTKPLAAITSTPDTYAVNSPLIRMDDRGVSPARHILLALMCHNTTNNCLAPPLDAIDRLATASGVWAEIIDLHTHNGRGTLHFDPEASALYLILSQKLKSMANNHGD